MTTLPDDGATFGYDVPDDGDGPDTPAAAAVRAETANEPASREEARAAAEDLVPPEGTVTVRLVTDDTDDDGEPVRIIPPGLWRSSAMRALNQGDFDRWAEGVLFGPDYAEVWRDLDPTNDDVAAFMKSYREAVGQSAGESRASRRSSRSTARR
jgi:hypothetical protein